MSSNLAEWKSRRDVDTRKKRAYGELTFDHPLKNVVVTDRLARRIFPSQPSTGRNTPLSTATTISEPLAQALKKLDPLTEIALKEELDPLTKMARELDQVDSVYVKKPDKRGDKDFWSGRRGGILQKYTTSEKLSMVTSFLMEGEKVVVKAQSTSIDKVQHRLEQLDCFEEGQRKLDLSQAEYTHKIEQLNKELVEAWNTEQRVKALKIAIQCAKMLADTDVLPFYPSKFVLVTDILDVFGKLVYERLRTKSVYYKPGTRVQMPLPEDFTPDMVPESAKETCLNWFFKIASIRELVPRLYVEMALIRSYNFISKNECPEALNRLTEIIQGIGNPLVAIYARCYLTRVGLGVSSKNMDMGFIKRNFEGFLETYQHIFSRSVKLQLKQQKMSLSTYMTLYTPSLDFIMECLVHHQTEGVLSELLDKCHTYSNSSLILNTIMSGYKPVFVSNHALQFLTMIGQCQDDGIPLHSLLRTLGLCISLAPPLSDHTSILHALYGLMTQLHDPSQFISCVEVWMKFIAQHFGVGEVNKLWGRVVEVVRGSGGGVFGAEVRGIVFGVVQSGCDMEGVLAMESFLPLMNLFVEETQKVEVCKKVLGVKELTDLRTSDPVIVNALMYLGGVLHDYVNALTPNDELRQIGEILCKLILMVEYGDFEQQLQFYVDSRGYFANLDAVLGQLVQQVNLLAVKTRQIVKGFHTRKTGDFVRACAAYCFITIPSIEEATMRLKLYLLSGQVALFNHCLGQADACFKAILSVLPELPSSSELFLLSFLRQFLSVLLIVPDNPERGVLSIMRQLLRIIRNWEWGDKSLLGAIYINAIDLLVVMGAEAFPYRVDGVDSNDCLWGSDPRFLDELDAMTSALVGEVLSILKELGHCRKQAQLAVDLFWRIVTRGDLSVEDLQMLSVNLWNLAVKHGYADVKLMARTKGYLVYVAERENDEILLRIVQKCNLPK